MDQHRVESSADSEPDAGPGEADDGGGEREAGEARVESWGPVAMIVLALLGIVAYANSFQAPVTYLDASEVFGNAALRQFATLADSPISPHGGIVAPATFALNYALGIGIQTGGAGEGPWGFRGLNVLIHIATGLLLFGLVRRTLLRFGPEWVTERIASLGAMAAAAIWLVHPMQTASVTMISGRTEALAGLFVLLSMYAFVRSVDSARQSAWLMVCVAASWAGAATGIVAAVIPLLVLAFDRVFVSRSVGAALRGRAWMYGGMTGAWVIAALMVRSSAASAATDPWADMSWIEYARVQVWAVPQLIRQALWPNALILDYGPPGHGVAAGIPPGAYVMHGLIVLVLAVLIAVGLLLRPVVGFLGVAMLLPLVPAALVINRVEIVADHRMYLPLAAMVCAVATGCIWLARPRNGGQAHAAGWIAAGVLGVALIAACAWATVARNADARRPAILYAETTARVPNNPRLLAALGSALLFPGDQHQAQPVDAMRVAEQAVKLNPRYAVAHRTLGEAMVMTKQYAEAARAFQEAVRLAPDDVRAHFHLAQDLAKLGRHDEALAEYERTLALQPNLLPARAQAAAACLELGLRRAIDYLHEVVQVQPNNFEVLMMLGIALAQEQRLTEAKLVFEHMLLLDPESTSARSNLEKIQAAAASQPTSP